MTSGYAGFASLFAVSIIALAYLGRKIIVKQGRPSDFGSEKQEEVTERKPVEEEAGPPEKQEEVLERKPGGEEAGPSTSTPEKGCFDYDVFISFRGKDTRNGFTSHLYKELDTRGIAVFVDSEDLKKGEKISNPFEHIERSKILVPVFSQNYADSKWCLKEIAKMVEIYKREGKRRPIIPIFYHVDPSDVRQSKKSFGKAFKEHQQNKQLGEKEINEWKAALAEAGKISGFHLSKDERTEAEIITHIGNGVSDILCKVPFNIQPIGIKSYIDTLEQMLEKEKECVRMIGICGMGGIGKTTLAMALYNEFFHVFEDCCFLSDIRENVKGEGLLSLQKKLIESILNESMSTGDVKQRLRSKKVLLVLDDVNDKEQLKALTGDRGKKEECFGAGSKIIITTRDEGVLLDHGLQKRDIYFPEGLNRKDSLVLFHMHAFDEAPKSDKHKGPSWWEVVDVAQEVVEVAQGLPLALTEFGSLFYRLEEKHEWEEELKKIKMDQQKKLHERLKISYDDLDGYEKCVFLDIACFFIGKKKEYPVYMWEACNYSPTVTLEVLQHKSLIKVNENDEFEMHDQIRDMGRRIVKEEGNFDPLTYSRLWRKSQVLEVLADAKVSMANPNVQGIDFQKVGDEAIEMSWKVIEKMQSLRMIIGANHGRCSVDEEEIIRFPSNLRWFNWNNCPYETLAFHDDQHEKICVLELTWGDFLDFRSHSMAFPNLKVLDLSGCWHLIRTPDFTRFPSLQKLVLDRCCSLTKIDESIGHLKELMELSMVGCNQISVLPDAIAFPNLKVLNLRGCSCLIRTPDFTYFPSLQKLVLDECCSLTKIDESIGRLKELEELCMVGCEQISWLRQRLLIRPDVGEEKAAHNLRQLTRTDMSCRSTLASDKDLLNALFELTTSRSPQVQSDSVATIVNLSLEKENKVQLVRAGALRFLLDVLRRGCSEARGHAAAAIFSLAVEEENRSVITAIGGIPLLLELLGSGGGGDIGAAEDAAMALYYLSLQTANGVKLIQAGAVPILARHARRGTAVVGDHGSASADDGAVRARCFMILTNLATLEEGRRALLGCDVIDSATETIVLAKGAGPVVEHALALMLLMVCKGKVRLVDTGADSGLLSELRKLASVGAGRAKEKAATLLKVLKEVHAVEFDDYVGGGGRDPPPPPVASSSGWSGYHEANTAAF